MKQASVAIGESEFDISFLRSDALARASDFDCMAKSD
jgi:hypothetical protein